MSNPEISIKSTCKNLLQALENKNIDTIYLAYSGGLDSSVTCSLHQSVVVQG